MADNGDKIGWFNFTNVLIGIAIVIQSTQWAFIVDLSNKVFAHLTNSDLHAPRSTFVEAAKFDLYQKMRDDQMRSMVDTLTEIRIMIREHILASEKKDGRTP
jgi:hypothetical protein